MQICEHLAQADCGIVANEGQLVKFHPLPRQLKYVKELDLELVPFISDKSRERLKHYEKSGYLQQEGISTVIALGQRGEFGYSTDIPDVEVATEIALDYCNLYSRKTQCFVYSVNNDVVFNPSTEIISDKKGN